MDNPRSLSMANSSGRTYRSTGRCSFVGCRYWPSVRMSHPAARRSLITSSTSSVALPQPEHQPAFCGHPRPLRPVAAAPAPDRTSPAAAPARTAGGPSRCCDSECRDGIDHRLQRPPVTPEIRDQHLDRDPGRASRACRIVSANTDAPPSGSSSRFTDVITAWRTPMIRIASATRAGSSRSRPAGRPGLHRTEAARARAHVAENHERRRPGIPAFAHVRTPRLLAHRVQPVLRPSTPSAGHSSHRTASAPSATPAAAAAPPAPPPRLYPLSCSRWYTLRCPLRSRQLHRAVKLSRFFTISSRNIPPSTPSTIR